MRCPWCSNILNTWSGLDHHCAIPGCPLEWIKRTAFGTTVSWKIDFYDDLYVERVTIDGWLFCGWKQEAS